MGKMKKPNFSALASHLLNQGNEKLQSKVEKMKELLDEVWKILPENKRLYWWNRVMKEKTVLGRIEICETIINYWKKKGRKVEDDTTGKNKKFSKS